MIYHYFMKIEIDANETRESDDASVFAHIAGFIMGFIAPGVELDSQKEFAAISLIIIAITIALVVFID